MTGENLVLSGQGVQAEESLSRRYLPECEEVGGGLFNYRQARGCSFQSAPGSRNKAQPALSAGCNRVGCMPCIMCAKDELREIAARWPEEAARVREWERLVSDRLRHSDRSHRQV